MGRYSFHQASVYIMGTDNVIYINFDKVRHNNEMKAERGVIA